MAALRLMQSVRVLPAISHGILRYNSSTSFFEIKKVQEYLLNNSPTFNAIVEWKTMIYYWRLRHKNQHLYLTEASYGKNATAIHFTLEQKGGLRFKGHTEWFRPNLKGQYTLEFLQHKDLPIECVDLSRSCVNFMGLSNIEGLQELRELNLSYCHFLDDWALSRLYMFKDSLEVLSLAGCCQVTERGLATLHHLQNLKHLDLSDLPSVCNKGLILILLEDMLPACEIVGIEYSDGLHTEQIADSSEHQK